MKYLIGAIFFTLGVLCGETSADELDQIIPAKIAADNVFRGAWSPDQQSFYFFKSVPGGEENYRIFVSHNLRGTWSEAKQVNLGGDHSDMYPSISSDGSMLVFSSYRPVPGVEQERPNANLWLANWDGDGWGEPVFLENLNTIENYDAGPIFGPNDDIYFGSTLPDWTMTRSLVSRYTEDGFARPVAVDALERWMNWRYDKHVWGGVVGPGEAFTILEVSDIDLETERPGPADLWVSHRLDSGWSEPTPLNVSINTLGNENFVFFSPDGRRLGFTRDFKEIYDISLEEALRH